MAGYDELMTALGGVNQSLNNATNLAFASKTSRQDREFTREMYEKQVQTARENWEMQNKYNLPSAVRQRYEDAGLNPLILYGSGGASMSAAGSIGQSAPVTRTSPLPHTEAVGTQMGLQMASIRNLQADSTLKEAQAEANLATARKESSETEFNRYSFRSRLEEIERRNDLNRSTAALNEQLAKTEPYKREQIEETKKYLATQAEDLENQMKNRDIITAAQKEKIDTEIKNSIKQTAHAVALMDQEARKFAAEAFQLEIEGAIKDMPEWQISYLNKMIGEAKQAIYAGHEAEISAVFQRYLWDNMPKYDSSSYDYRKWLHNYVTPTTQAFGALLGGSGAAAISLLK